MAPPLDLAPQGPSPERRPPTPPDLSVVMPCLDEEATVGACIEDARGFIVRRGLSGEVIVVDNGSTDRSAEVARRHGADVVSEP
ncbi:MAG: glycosyltransferase, partial [Atopobiaceae bacterium]|nr:glycosyltransferase [Atopobiaceae bacterium]